MTKYNENTLIDDGGKDERRSQMDGKKEKKKPRIKNDIIGKIMHFFIGDRGQKGFDI